jgi:hypothetical protein
VAWLAIAAALVAVAALALLRLRGAHGAAKRAPKEHMTADRRVENAELQEIELDYAMGKLSQDDYRALVARYTRSDPRELEPEASPPAVHSGVGESTGTIELEREAEAMVKHARGTIVTCPECGPRPEPQATYCSNCGRYLHRCPSCGQEIVVALARYCPNCGKPLSAPDAPVSGAPAAAGTE